jgi:hypothetical protein
MMKLVWVSPRDPAGGSGLQDADTGEAADTHPAGDLGVWEWLLVAASGVYAVALFGAFGGCSLHRPNIRARQDRAGAELLLEALDPRA